MNIELKKVQIHPDLSEETMCFSAEVHVDGKLIGTVRNGGRGGSHNYFWEDRRAGQRLQEWAQSQPTEFEFEKLDQIINDLAAQRETLRRLKRLTRNRTLIRLKGDARGFWRKLYVRCNAAVLLELQQTHGDRLECIANVDLKAALAFC